MGGCLSCRSSPTVKYIRLVHLNGYVEDFEQPVTVSQVTGKRAKHLVYTKAQLLSPCSRPLKPETQLEPGLIYFLLPCSTLQSDASPMDMATTVRKLMAIAKTTGYGCEVKSLSSSDFSSRSSPVGSPHRFSHLGEVQTGLPPQKSCGGGRSWKPLLDTIGEQSFPRKSESDLSQGCKHTSKS